MKLVILLLCVLIASCVSLDENYSNKAVLIPLSNGNEWHYVSDDGSKTVKNSILKSQTVNNKTWYQYQEFGNFFWVRNEGLAQYEPDAYGRDYVLETDKEYLVYDASSGKEREYLLNGDKVIYKPCEKETSVPAGSFSCHRFEIVFSNGDKSISYFSEGIGLLLNEFIVNGKSEIWKLKKFKINKSH